MLYSQRKFFRNNKIIGIILILLAFALYLYLVIPANIENSTHRYSLYMDEMVVFDQIEKMFTSKGLKEFIHTLVFQEYRYGQILWNSSYVASFIPRYFFGDQGQIVATRMLLALALFASYLIFSLTFLRTWILRGIAIFFLIALPTTFYYATMPKPEPLQLLFFSLFFFFFTKARGRFSFSYFFLGMAFGAKASLLFFMPFPFLISLYLEHKDNPKLTWNDKGVIITLATFLLGILIANPVTFYNFLYYSLTIVNNSMHGADSTHNQFLNWISFIFFKYSTVSPILTIAFFSISSIFLALFILKNKKNKEVFLHYLALFCSAILLASILVLVKRIWDFYLHPGIVIFILSLLGIAEYQVFKNEKINLSKILGAIIILLSISLTFFLITKDTGKRFSNLAHETSSKDFIQKQNEYDFLNKFYGEHALKLRKKIQICADSNLFHSKKENDLFQVDRIFGPISNKNTWDKNPDIIVLYKDTKSINLNNVREDNIHYKAVKLSKALFDLYTDENNPNSLYQKILLPKHLDNIIVFIRN